jgi:starch-binding outer membrane protein, SusD/RagB family
MKIFKKIVIALLFPVVLFSACDTLLDVDSDRHIFEDEHGMNSANDTLYAMNGVFSQLQKLADSYVVLGELRGDLMDVNENSSRFLKEVNNFDFSTENPYSSNIRDYYAIINNCNYIIHNIDTSVVTGGVKVMQKTYAAAKAVRAWTYLQTFLNFGKVKYYEKPILSLDDAQKTYPEYTDINQLAPLLIEDIKPWKSVEKPQFGSFQSYSSNLGFFSIRFLLGDLYLWKGDYEMAANEYRDLMYFDRITINSSLRSALVVTNDAFTGGAIVNWTLWFNNTYGSEMITNLYATNQHNLTFTIDSLAREKYLIPSEKAVSNWFTQRYTHSATLDTIVDLRWYGSINQGYIINDDMKIEPSGKYSINKFSELNSDEYVTKQVPVYRAALLYLRYAEAVNRLGKPKLAMAVLKNGLKASTINSNILVPPSERDSIGSVLKNYMNFSDERFVGNIGIRTRGCGSVNLDTTYYVIPKNMMDKDSIMNYVEDLIVNELALETAFEGNRFHDLMRVAMRRGEAYLADKVAEKHTTNKEAIRSKLMNRSNWFLK